MNALVPVQTFRFGTLLFNHRGEFVKQIYFKPKLKVQTEAQTAIQALETVLRQQPWGFKNIKFVKAKFDGDKAKFTFDLVR